MKSLIIIFSLLTISCGNIQDVKTQNVEYRYENYSITQDVIHVSVPDDSDTTYIRGVFEGVLGIPAIISNDIGQSDVNLNKEDLRKLRSLVDGGELNEVYGIINRKVQF